jgi:hypothetical protein
LSSEFPDAEPPGARQIVRLHVDLVLTSCGYGTPLFDHRGELASLNNWARSKGVDGFEAYRRERNVLSIDDLPAGLFEDA